MPASDPDFTRYCTTGDEPSFRALVSAHLPMVLGVAARKLGPHAHLAQDVAQSVFTRMARVAKGVRHDLIVAPWLHRQAVRLAIDTVRREERRLRRETTAAMLHAPDSQPATPTEAAHLLDEALDQLPAADRSVLVLRYLEERDFESVARSLGSTPEAARKRIARSLEKLRALLTRRGVALTTAALTGFLSEQSAHAAPAALTARVSTTAIKAAATGKTAAILTTALMSHAAALTTGALAALFACGVFYLQREKEFAGRAAAAPPARLAPAQNGSFRPDGSTSSTAPLPRTLPEIIAAMEEITSGPDHRLARLRIAALLRRIPPEQYLEFYLTAESRIHPLRWRALVIESARQWKQTDPGAVTQALFASDNRKRALLREVPFHLNMTFNSFEISTNREGGSHSNAIIKETLADWLKRDATAARHWFQSMSDEPLMTMRWLHGTTLGHQLGVLIAGHLPHDGPLTSLATTGLTERQTLILQQKWADGILDSETDFGNVLATRAATTGEARLLAHRAAERDPEACQRAIHELRDDDLRYAAALGFASQYAIKDATSFTSLDANARLPRAQFALENAGQRSVRETLGEIVSALFQYPTDGADLFRAWVVEKGGAEAGDALAAGARRLAELDYSIGEALAWAAAVPDAAQRGPLLRGIFLRWSDSAPNAAAQFLGKAPPDLAAELRPLMEAL